MNIRKWKLMVSEEYSREKKNNTTTVSLNQKKEIQHKKKFKRKK